MAPGLTISDESPLGLANGENGLTMSNGISNGINPLKSIPNGNGIGETNNSMPVVKHSSLSRNFPVSLPYPIQQLGDRATTSHLAKVFHCNNIVDKHAFHYEEHKKILSSEHLDIDSKTYMEKRLDLEVIRDTEYDIYVHNRNRLAAQLQAALEDSDKVLEALFKATEELGVAKHDKELAEEAREAAELARHKLKEELATVTCELHNARLRLFEVVQIEALKSDIEKLQATVTRLNNELVNAVTKYQKAQKEERLAKQQLEVLRKEVESLENDKRLLDKTISVLQGEALRLRNELTKVTLDYTAVKNEAQTLEEENTRLKGDVKSAIDGKKKAEENANAAESARDDAEERCKEACDGETKAKEERDAADSARKSAENSAVEAMNMYQDILSHFKDTQYHLDQETREKQVMKGQRDNAIERASVACHYTQESIEWGQALNLINHQLLQQYQTMQSRELQAIEDKLSEERQKDIAEGEAIFAQRIRWELEQQREDLLEQQRQTQVEISTLNLQYAKKQGQLQSQLAEMTAEVDKVRAAQLGWDGERSEYLQSIKDKDSEYVDLKTENRDLSDQLSQIRDQDAELKADFDRVKQERTSVEQHLKAELDAEMKKREASEKALRESHVSDILKHQDKEKSLQDQLNAEIEKSADWEKQYAEKLRAQQDEFEKLKRQLEEQKQKEEQELRDNFAESQQQIQNDHQLQLKKAQENLKRGVPCDLVWIQDIFLGNERVDENKKKDIYTKIGNHFGSQEPFHLDHVFTDAKDKKKQVVVLYVSNQSKSAPHILSASVEGTLKLHKF